MKQRPSYPSVLVRQRNIIEGIGTSNLKYAQAAKQFGVTRREFKRFVESSPQSLHKNFNRSPSYRKLYEKGTRSEVRTTLSLKRIRHYAYTEREIALLKFDTSLTPEELNRQKQIGRMIQRIYVLDDIKKPFARYEWAVFTREHNLPLSIKAIRLLHRNGKISDRRYFFILEVWKHLYPITESVAELYYADLLLEFQIA